MTYAFTPIELSPIAQMHALRRMFGTDERFPREVLASIAVTARAQRVAAGVELARQGEPFPNIFLIVEGQLELTRQGKRIGHFTSGETVGVLSALSGDKLGFGCRTLAECVLIVLRLADLFEMMEDYFELMHGALRNVASEAIRLRRTLPNGGFLPRGSQECVDCGAAPLGLVQRIFHLRRTIGLEHSYIDELAELARAAREHRVASGTQLWKTGDRADHPLIVVSGQVEGQMPEGGTFHFGPGDILGNLDTIAGEARWFDAHAASDLVTLSIDSEAIVDVWEDHPALGFAFLRMYTRLILELRLQMVQLEPAA